MLEVENLSVHYGKVRALDGVSLRVGKGEIVSLVGVNGAGKSSLMQAVAGLVRPSGGRILLDGKPIEGRPAHAIARLGLAMVPEGRDLFADMSVMENLEMGAYQFGGTVRLQDEIRRVGTYFPVLLERSRQRASTLSGGEQQMLAVARALMARPRILLLDEPSLGIAPRVIELIFRIVAAINREEGTTVLLVEQNTSLALAVSNRTYVMQTGRIAVEGASSELARSEEIRRAYLGMD